MTSFATSSTLWNKMLPASVPMSLGVHSFPIPSTSNNTRDAAVSYSSSNMSPDSSEECIPEWLAAMSIEETDISTNPKAMWAMFGGYIKRNGHRVGITEGHHNEVIDLLNAEQSDELDELRNIVERESMHARAANHARAVGQKKIRLQRGTIFNMKRKAFQHNDKLEQQAQLVKSLEGTKQNLWNKTLDLYAENDRLEKITDKQCQDINNLEKANRADQIRITTLRNRYNTVRKGNEATLAIFHRVQAINVERVAALKIESRYLRGEFDHAQQKSATHLNLDKVLQSEIDDIKHAKCLACVRSSGCFIREGRVCPPNLDMTIPDEEAKLCKKFCRHLKEHEGDPLIGALCRTLLPKYERIAEKYVLKHDLVDHSDAGETGSPE